MNSFGFLLNAGGFDPKTIIDMLALITGLALFLYGMNTMGDYLKKSAGSGLKNLLGKMTSNPIKGFLLGLGVTAIIQSSSATTVMVVGFVNSGTMTLMQAAGVIIGANVGTAVTAWLTAMSQMPGGSAGLEYLEFLKPDAWLPLLAIIGIALTMFAKREKKKDIGFILLGFAVLMTGMELMSGAVSQFRSDLAPLFTFFTDSHPAIVFIGGVLVGVVLTAIVQSSSASVGILQALTMTGAITWFAAIPIVMGQNIGTCVTAMISSLGANRNGKRAAVIHLAFNVIGVVLVSIIFYILWSLIAPIQAFSDGVVNAFDIAIIHTVFKIVCVALIDPFYKVLVKIACILVKDKKDETQEKVNLMDERLLDTPAIAVERATQVAGIMARMSTDSLQDSIKLFDSFDQKVADSVRDIESKVDTYEDSIGSYLIRVSSCPLDHRDSEQVTKLLHIIGDYERISDHAVNIVESAEEIREKKITFSPEAQRELEVLRSAVAEILDITTEAFINNDLKKAAEVEPLEQVVDEIRDKIRLNHILRLQKSECTIEHGFVLSDMLTNFERVADHCSNIAGCVIEISRYDALDMHKYLSSVKHGSEDFEQKYRAYANKYSV